MLFPSYPGRLRRTLKNIPVRERKLWVRGYQSGIQRKELWMLDFVLFLCCPSLFWLSSSVLQEFLQVTGKFQGLFFFHEEVLSHVTE